MFWWLCTAHCWVYCLSVFVCVSCHGVSKLQMFCKCQYKNKYKYKGVKNNCLTTLTVPPFVISAISYRYITLKCTVWIARSKDPSLTVHCCSDGLWGQSNENKKWQICCHSHLGMLFISWTRLSWSSYLYSPTFATTILSQCMRDITAQQCFK